ncbi:MAG: phosphatase PAP2 family protein [Ginsengibacter sp.]
MPPIEFFERLDKILFLLINHDSSYQYLDPVMLVARNPFTWIPLYIFIAWYMFVKIGKRGWQFILFSFITVAITDSCSTLLKNAFGRLRPCVNAEISGLVRHLVDCGGIYSFPSSHAANHFGMATFWFWAIYKTTGKKWRWLWIWASLICYAQVYAGKHFPSDIAAGALLGIITGTIMAKIFELAWDSKFNVQQILFSFKRKDIQPWHKSPYTIE